jgi:hypothetical protein
MENLELRMYGLVCYQLTGIQQAIQFGHAVVDYGQAAWSTSEVVQLYNDWANNYKTFIILNGGTTNKNPDKLGSLNQHLQTLKEKDVFCTPFHEPDLGDQLTAVVFIVDERVFNKEKYPDFDFTNKLQVTPGYGIWSEDPTNPQFLNELEAKRWEDWVISVGGQKNVWLRSWLKNFRLA